MLEDVGGIHLSVLCCWCSYTDSMVPHSILKPGELWAVSEALQGHTLPVEQPRHSGAPGGAGGPGQSSRGFPVEGEAFVKALPPA